MKQKKQLPEKLAKPMALIAMLFVFLVLGTNKLHAQSPACNVSGPLKTCLSESNIVIKAEVAYAEGTPELSYSFGANTSGASIISVGNYVYDANLQKGSQDVTINPGVSAGAFNLRLNVIRSDGQTSSCSKSVTVVRCQSQMGKQ